VTARSDTEVTLEVVARGRGRLVLLDTFYPGWEAEVDGRPVTIDAANAAFRAVPVDAGRQTVRFSYRPLSVTAGAVMSVLALLLVLGAGLILGRRAWTRDRSLGMMPTRVSHESSAVSTVGSDGPGGPGGG
jgi:uncharacterized membrane protein YfhO